jgi:hypothetical protein
VPSSFREARTQETPSSRPLAPSLYHRSFPIDQQTIVAAGVLPVKLTGVGMFTPSKGRYARQSRRGRGLSDMPLCCRQNAVQIMKSEGEKNKNEFSVRIFDSMIV